ncbi:hypothetical protein Tco_1180962 [Tanacetum coccineum]
MALTTSDSRYESIGVFVAHESSPTDSLMNEDSIPEEQKKKDQQLLNPAWTIPSSNISDVENNWASALVLTYEPPAENSLLDKIGDMTTFMNWYCSKVNKTVLTQAYFEGHAYEDLEYLRYGNKGSRPALSVYKMKAARYPDFGLELLVPEQLWIDEHLKEKSKITCEFSVSLVSKPIQDTALDYRVKEFKIKPLNPGMNTQFWTQKDVTGSKEFVSAIERRLKTRRIYQNLECFSGGRVRDIDYRLLQRME